MNSSMQPLKKRTGVLLRCAAMFQLPKVASLTPTAVTSGQGQPVYGRIVGIEQRADLVALLTLDNGIQLSVPASSRRSGDEPRTDATVVGRYVENGGQKVATSLRVIEAQAP